MNQYRFFVNRDDCVFRIVADHIPDVPVYSDRAGSGFDSLEITYVLNHRSILCVNCFEIESMYEIPISLPGSDLFEDPNEWLDGGKWYYNEEVYTCACILNRKEFAVIFCFDPESVMDPMFYHKSGRVKFLYDDVQTLLYIKVTDLTEDEYAFLKGFCRT